LFLRSSATATPSGFLSAACLGRPWAPGPGGSTSGGLAVGRAAGVPGQLGEEPVRPRRCRVVVVVLDRVLQSANWCACADSRSMEALVGCDHWWWSGRRGLLEGWPVVGAGAWQMLLGLRRRGGVCFGPSIVSRRVSWRGAQGAVCGGVWGGVGRVQVMSLSRGRVQRTPSRSIVWTWCGASVPYWTRLLWVSAVQLLWVFWLCVPAEAGGLFFGQVQNALGGRWVAHCCMCSHVRLRPGDLDRLLAGGEGIAGTAGHIDLCSMHAVLHTLPGVGNTV
jgi:hypothetical protein